MGNHIITKPRITTRMYLTKDKRYVITEMVITEKRSVKYYREQLLPNVAVKKKKTGSKGRKKR